MQFEYHSIDRVDGDGRSDILSKAWGVESWKAAGGRMHVDLLLNRTPPAR